MKEEILIVNGCQTCPLSHYNHNKEWVCTNFKKKPKNINLTFLDKYYPTWCPLQTKSLKLVLQ
jgi:hypothetical protein